MGERISGGVADMICAYVRETVRVLSRGGHPRWEPGEETVRGLRTRTGRSERVCTRRRVVGWQVVQRDTDGRHTRPGTKRRGNEGGVPTTIPTRRNRADQPTETGGMSVRGSSEDNKEEKEEKKRKRKGKGEEERIAAWLGTSGVLEKQEKGGACQSSSTGI